MREQRPLADRPHTRQLVEQGARHRLVAPLAVELDREPVRLVAHSLEQPQGLRVLLDRERGRAARNEDLLDPLREPNHGDAAIGERRQGPHAGRELALASVDHDQVGQRGEALVALRVVGREVRLLEEPRRAAAEHLLHGGEIVGALGALASNPEPAVVGLLRRSCLEHDHRGHGVVRTEVGDVKAFDPDGQRVELERVLQRGERVHPLLAPPLLAQLVLRECQARVALGQLTELALVAPLGDPHLDRAAAPGREGLLEQLDPVA